MARDKTIVHNRDGDEEFSEKEEYNIHGREEYNIHGRRRASNGGRGGGKSKGGSSRKRRRLIFVDDVAEEADDDEEEEEEDYYEDYGESRKKRKQSSAAAPFIDDQAIVASSDEEESTDGEGEDPFIVSNDEQEDDDDRRMRHKYRPHPSLSDGEEDIEEIERRIQHRYQSYDEDTDEADINDVEQQSRLPSVKDSKLWTVKCAIGREREAAFCLMQKCAIDQPGMHIRSAIALDYLQNYIYLEADKEAHVREACKGLKMLDTRKIVLVPIKEMTDVVSAKGKALDIVKDMWVRIKVGIYKGDLAKVVGVPDMRQRVMLKLIPRVDLLAVADKLDGRKVSKKAITPSQRLVNSGEARNLNIPVDSRREQSTAICFDVIDGKMFKDSFLYKTVSKKSIEYQNIQPSLDELERFCESGMSTSVENRRKFHYMKGDAVVVVKGDLTNLMGRVEKVEDDNLHIKPNRKDLHTTIVLNENYVCKYFKLGDHVKVVSGAHEGATGTVIKVNSNVLILVSDATREYISVFADNVVDSSRVVSGATTRIGDYELHDLVMLADMSFGVIIRLESESLQVLKGDPDRPVVAVVKLREIKFKIDDRRNTAKDRFRNDVSVKDVVKILTGPCQGKQGTVEHIRGGILFINDRHHMEHSGFICAQAQSCLAVGGSNAKVSLPSRCAASRQTAYIPPSARRYSTGPPLDSVVRHRGAAAGRGGHDNFVGSIVKIRLGNYKGCSGRVVSRNGQLVRVELESQMKTVTVKREEISVDASVFTSSSEAPQQGIGSQTPMHRAQTPLHPYMTPMRDQGGQTPVHCGMRTPLRHQAWNPYAISTW
ncbi:hypothetical protein C5167_048621 [Papaver somniferum]|uniref:KOW domain-containing protein n=2 Tax=Papaver somniferum TaxID=3469 RepID=A0A4Y7KMH1_PAPSO|nr:hypothetical protein C5167_048621 [Papaver somniferum]